eukprot:UN12813
MPKKYVTELAVAELLRGLILFRQAGDTTSIVYSLIGTSASSNVFISENLRRSSNCNTFSNFSDALK